VLLDNGMTTIPVLDIDNVNVGPYIRNTMAADKNMAATARSWTSTA
jgi:DNA-directed RNA polymerase subunit beta